MLPIEPLGIAAPKWRFLDDPDKYVATSERVLVPTSTARQFATAKEILARLSGAHGRKAGRGILLADDVGLGKTTVAALVAWVFAGSGKRVRILAPNGVMARRWLKELTTHVVPLQTHAPRLNVSQRQLKPRKGGRLTNGTIQIVHHSYATAGRPMDCDLLIIDEAHRAKGKDSKFSKELGRHREQARRVMILTATPFSIQIKEFERMLTLIGGESAHKPVQAFSRALDDLYLGSTSRDPEKIADKLVVKARAAVESLAPHVIRHSVEHVPKERAAFGDRSDWKIEVPGIRPAELELMLRLDRSLRLAKRGGASLAGATNDPRFHVGWRHLDTVRADLADSVHTIKGADRRVVEEHVKLLKPLRAKAGVHPKMLRVSAEVCATVAEGEKVLVFCHHHATVTELARQLARAVPPLPRVPMPAASVWRAAWEQVVQRTGKVKWEREPFATFVTWMSSDLIRTQTWGWIDGTLPMTAEVLVQHLRTIKARSSHAQETIAEAVQRLYDAMLESASSRAVLVARSRNDAIRLPGTLRSHRVIAVCTADDGDDHELFVEKQPDTIIALFNSPFGPDVLIATDKLSEGVDLHRYCRHLIHYELAPSPIRTVQRNGRVRRVNSWGSVVQQPIKYAYPAFGGTRDHRLVQIMKKRIDSFSLLLGGVPDFELAEVHGADEAWRSQVIARAKVQLARLGAKLTVRARRGARR